MFYYLCYIDVDDFSFAFTMRVYIGARGLANSDHLPTSFFLYIYNFFLMHMPCKKLNNKEKEVNIHIYLNLISRNQMQCQLSTWLVMVKLLLHILLCLFFCVYVSRERTKLKRPSYIVRNLIANQSFPLIYNFFLFFFLLIYDIHLPTFQLYIFNTCIINKRLFFL